MRTLRCDIQTSETKFALDQPAFVTEEGSELIVFRHRFRDPDIEPVEGIVVEYEIDGDVTHLVVLMADDHAARLAVSDDAHGVLWGSDDV